MYTHVFFFKQKTAYEIGTGDWSSDVCSSDLESDIRKPQVDLSKVKVTSSIFSSVQNRYGETFYLYLICVRACDMIYKEFNLAALLRIVNNGKDTLRRLTACSLHNIDITNI